LDVLGGKSHLSALVGAVAIDLVGGRRFRVAVLDLPV
jgi:hypothetical protein